MQFVVLRTLKQSEIGWFGEVRRQGRETSRQRAVNFDGVTVDRLFPTAGSRDEIHIDLTHRNDVYAPTVQRQTLKQQHKNWRLTGQKIDDARFAFVTAGDLLVMRIDTAGELPSGAFEVLPPDHEVARRILARPEASALISTGLIALHPSEAGPIPQILARMDPDLFGSLASDRGNAHEGPSPMTPSEDPLLVIPSAARMFQVVGNLGHNLPIAIADLIDNSIVARATRIEVNWPRPDNGQRWLSIVDNGTGMDRNALLEAMRFGSVRDYADRDLGKFGIGLKAASLSQARVLTVASRTSEGSVSVLRWDQDAVERGRDWRLVEPELAEWEEQALLNPLEAEAGTVVLWDRVMPPRAIRRRTRRVSDPTIPDDAYGRALHNLSLHLGMVFHRFLQGQTRSGRRTEILINGQAIEPWDPFLPSHPKTCALPGFAENLPGPGDVDCPVTGRPVVLPHKAQFRDESQWRRAGFDGQWNQRQGLYIYRADRLIQAGGWCDIWQRDEHTKLLRVALAFDPELDDLFEINAAKMSVTLPPLLARALRGNLKEARKTARRRYKERGGTNRKPKKPPGKGFKASSSAAGPRPPTPSTLTADAGTPPGKPASTPTVPETPVGATLHPDAPLDTPSSPPSPPRLIHDRRDGAKAWAVESTLLGGRDVRLDRNHTLGQKLATVVPPGHPASSVLAALIIAVESSPIGAESVEALLLDWTPETGDSDA
ncbi:MAG: ATP-binding protein [Myxococcota bacterium]|nr:ATP-binding protein [Myxococcota bacterium]